MTLGWHILPAHGRLLDGSPVPIDDKWAPHRPAQLCQSGYHASKSLFDALNYASGTTICRVQLQNVVEGDDKMVGTTRRIIWRYDAAKLMCDFWVERAMSYQDKPPLSKDVTDWLQGRPDAARPNHHNLSKLKNTLGVRHGEAGWHGTVYFAIILRELFDNQEYANMPFYFIQAEFWDTRVSSHEQLEKAFIKRLRANHRLGVPTL